MVNEEIIDTMLRMAKDARQQAFLASDAKPEGACVLTTDGTLYVAATLENSSGERVCTAARVAIAKAIADSKLDFDALAVVKESVLPDGLSPETHALIKEFQIPDIVLGTEDGQAKTYPAAELTV